MRRVIVLAVVMTVFGLAASPSVAAVRDPNGGDVPFYARIEHGGFAVSDGDLTMIYFYRPPVCIPDEFNLLDFFDFSGAAFVCGPPTVEGHALWETGILVDPAPFFSKLSGLGAVPVWFVERADYDAAISDGDLTIGELEGLDPLKGTASTFNEVLRPSEVENVAMLIVRLSGQLEDGRPFSANHVHVHTGPEPSTTNITIG